MTLIKRCFASNVEIKTKGYTNQDPKRINSAINRMNSKGWVVAEKSVISNYSLITFVRKEDLSTYLSFEEERKKIKSLVTIKDIKDSQS